jgi:rod shape determining protein RodA
MREKSERLFYNVDWLLVVFFLLLVTMGWMNIYSAVYDEQKSNIFDFTHRQESKQMVFVFISIVIGVGILVLDASFFTATAIFIYAGIILLNVVVAFAGADVKGSKSWFKFAGFTLQPAEFAKWATGLALAKFLSGLNKPDIKTALPVALALIAIPVFIMIIFQHETGVALVFGALVLVLYREGLMAGWILATGLGSILAMVIGIKYPDAIMWIVLGFLAIGIIRFFLLRKKTILQAVLTIVAVLYLAGLMYGSSRVIEKMPEHQTGRIKCWLGLPVSQAMMDKYDYNTRQSLIAIGSGGMWGKGYLQGTQTKFRFVPEQETDFIFCTVGEEWGFVGCTVLILIYGMLIVRIIILSERQRSDFTRIYGYAVASIFLFHLLVNVGMTVGILPVIGIPLPFFSYGGSSLISFTILLFIFIKLDSQRLLILR